MTTLKIINARIPDLTGIRENISILIEDGIIKKVSNNISAPYDYLIDANGNLVLPGLIDIHTHLRDFALSYKETFYSGTAAAAAGGITTVFDMPNTDPPTNSIKKIETKVSRISNEKLVNVGLYSGVPSMLNELDKIVKNPYIFGIKIFLYSDVFRKNLKNTINLILHHLKGVSIPLLIHGELPLQYNKYNNVSEFLYIHNALRELLAYLEILSINQNVKHHIHFCHVSLPSAAYLLSNSENVTFEVTPHHLFLNNSILTESDGIAKCLPPLRSNYCQKALIKMLYGGLIKIIATDHAPHALSEKVCTFNVAANGITGLETLFPLLFTEVSKGNLSLSDFISLVSRNPAKLMHLNKGEIFSGYDGDLIIVSPNTKWKIRGDNFHSKSKITPFEGYSVTGKILYTIVGGKTVYSNNMIVSKPGESGKVLKRN